MVAGGEVAAGIAHDGQAQLPQRFQHVPAQAVFVRVAGVRLVHAVVDGAAHVLQEAAEQARIHRAHGVPGVQIRWNGDATAVEGSFHRAWQTVTLSILVNVALGRLAGLPRN